MIGRIFSQNKLSLELYVLSVMVYILFIIFFTFSKGLLI